MFISEKNVRPFMEMKRQQVISAICDLTPLITPIATLIAQYDITLSDKYKLGKVAKHKQRIAKCLKRKKERKCLYFNSYTPTIPIARVISLLNEDARYWEGVDEKKTSQLRALVAEISGTDPAYEQVRKLPYSFWISPKIYAEIKACRRMILRLPDQLV